jgi:hypothetical protein
MNITAATHEDLAAVLWQRAPKDEERALDV